MKVNGQPQYALIPSRRGIPGTVPSEQLSTADLVQGIREGRWKEQIDPVRQLVADGKRGTPEHTKAKSALDAFILSVACNHRKKGASDADKFIAHNYRLQVDLDFHKSGDDLEQEKERLAHDPHFEFVAISPSGDGLKSSIVVETPEPITVENFRDWQQLIYEQADDYLFSKYGIRNDKAVKDPYRLCYVTYDPGVIANPDPVPLQITVPVPAPALAADKADAKADTENHEIRENETKSKTKETKTKVEKMVESWCRAIRKAKSGNRHLTVMKYAELAGGYIAGEGWDEDAIYRQLLEAANEAAPERPEDNANAVRDGIAHGKENALQVTTAKTQAIIERLEKQGITVDYDDVKNISDIEIRECIHGGEKQDAALFHRVFGHLFGYAPTLERDVTAKGSYFIYKSGPWSEYTELAGQPFASMLDLLQNIYWGFRNRLDDDEKKTCTAKIKEQNTTAFRSKLITWLKDYQINRTDFESRDDLVLFRNGVVDLKTGEQVEHSPLFRQLLSVPHDYDPHAQCPEYDKFILTCFDGDAEMVEYWWSLLGSCLSGKAHEAIYIAKGKVHRDYNGSNGKSIAIGIPLSLVGNYGVSVDPNSLFQIDRGAKQTRGEMLGKRMANLGEIKQSTPITDAIRDTIQINEALKAYKLFWGDFTFMAKFTCFASCNLPPLIKGTDEEGTRRRLVFIPFNHHYPKCDAATTAYWTNTYKSEGAGILAKMVRYAVKYFATPIPVPQKVLDCTDQTWNDRRTFDSLERFIDESGLYVKNHNGKVEVGSFNRAYHMWYQTMKEHEPRNFILIAGNMIKQRMEEMGFEQKTGRMDDGKQRRVYRGLMLASEQDMPDTLPPLRGGPALDL